MSIDITKQIMASARNSCLEDLAAQLKIINFQWFKCCYSTGDTPLHIAAKEGHVEVMKYLLQNLLPDQNYVDIPTRSGKTPLHEACQNAQPEAVSFLISKGANCRSIKQADWTPLMLACTRKGTKALQCCQILINQAGLVVLKDKNKDGWNAFHIAAREGDVAIVKALLQLDTSQALISSKNGRTPLHTGALHGCSEIVELLLNFAAVDCNARDSCGSTPVHDAVRSGNLQTVVLLAQAGADLGIFDNQGQGILHMAAEVGHPEMVRFLCEEYNVHKIFAKDCVITPLHCAVRSGRRKAAEVLLQFGANSLVMDGWGRSCQDLIPEISKEESEKLIQLLSQPHRHDDNKKIP